MKFTKPCTVCGGNNFSNNEVLWPELIDAWELDTHEVDYINRQQGFACSECGNNLRSLALADSILSAYNFSGTLLQFVDSDIAKNLKILEINEAGGLSSVLKMLPDHQLVQYPEYDMTKLSFESEGFDLVVHSDTLEHVPDPVKGLSECCRVLRSNGKCIFTVPVIVDRMSRSRIGLTASYHGQSGVPADDQIVCTEFGADVWQTVIKAGFRSCEIFSLEYPSALVMIARK